MFVRRGPPSCPDSETMAMYLAGELDEARRDPIRGHVDRCSACNHLAGDFVRTMHESRGSESTGATTDAAPDSSGGVHLSPLPLRPGYPFEGYLVTGLLGRGGMGVVFSARDPELEREVAIKVAFGAASAVERARVRVEARAVARLHHPNVLEIYEAGEVEGHPYIVTERLFGSSLARLGGPLPPTQVIAIGLDLARGLAAAHKVGVIHRDIKPANAFLTERGVAKLLDFGLARVEEHAVPIPTSGEHSALSLELMATARASASGRIAGTPLFMAPETWRGEEPTRKTDIYSLGALLFVLLTGSPPVLGATLEELRERVVRGEQGVLTGRSLEVPASLKQLVQKCLSLDPKERPDAGDVASALDALGGGLGMPVSTPPNGGSPANPYRGLLPFGPQHKDVFFGREADVRSILAEIVASPFVLVVGASGAGKSSLVRAGVLPRIARGALGPAGPRETVMLAPGATPVANLARALTRTVHTGEGPNDATPPDAWAHLAHTLRLQSRSLLLIVDPLEELFAIAGVEERAAFTVVLKTLVSSGTVRVLAVMREDFLTRLDELGALKEEALRDPVVLGPLHQQGLRRAIEDPARLHGVFLEPELVERLVEEAQRGSLPLLQFALSRLWEAREPQAVSIGVDTLLAIGGVEGALAEHADAVLSSLSSTEQEDARRVLLGLVTLERTRRQRTEDDLLPLGPAVRVALDALVAGRLVVAVGGDIGRSYELAHEALIKGWPALATWLEDDAAGRERAERLERYASEWERLGRGREGVVDEPRARELEGDERFLPSARARDFLAASRRASRRARRLAVSFVIGLPVAATLVAAGVAFARISGERARTRGVVATQIASARSGADAAMKLDAEVDSLRKEALARYDAADRRGGELLWEEADARARDVSARFATATQAASLALAADPRDGPARAVAGDLTLRRLLIAQRDHEAELLPDLLARLTTLDDDHSRTATLNAPAHLRVHSAVPGASVTLLRVRSSSDGYRTELEQGRLPLDMPTVLEPGPYVLAATADGHYPTRLPLTMRPEADTAVEVILPQLESIPEPFVFVPGGDSFIGVAEGPIVRGILSAPPEHLVHVDAFLMAARETTFREYIEFLSTLPRDQRDTRRPRAGSFVEMHFDARDQPILRMYGSTAAAGDSICRDHRTARRCQNWMDMPVVGISWDDANAYATWLGARRVSGARLCTEHEWERAARGGDDRRFVWGDEVHPGDANFDATYTTRGEEEGEDVVGSFPRDRSPFGVFDMAGNVSEWVLDNLDAAGTRWRNIRGGSWRGAEGYTRAASRSAVVPATLALVGIRVCAPYLGSAHTRIP